MGLGTVENSWNITQFLVCNPRGMYGHMYSSNFFLGIHRIIITHAPLTNVHSIVYLSEEDKLLFILE
jgi:hypothetical protein